MNLCIYGSLKLEQACSNFKEHLDMMLLQIEQACTNLREYLNMMLLQIEQACTNLQEHIYSLNIRKQQKGCNRNSFTTFLLQPFYLCFLASIPKTHN